jgi:hypothetical protein
MGLSTVYYSFIVAISFIGWRKPSTCHWSVIIFFGGRRERDRMVVGFIISYAPSAYHH